MQEEQLVAEQWNIKRWNCKTRWNCESRTNGELELHVKILRCKHV